MCDNRHHENLVVVQETRNKKRAFAKTQRIIRRTRYGLMKEINNYKSSLFDSFNFDLIESEARNEFERLQASFHQNGVFSGQKEFLENIADWLNISMNDLTRLALGFLTSAFILQTEKIFDTNGDKLEVDTSVITTAVSSIAQEQGRFIRNITERERQRVRRALELGVQQNKSFDDISSSLMRALKKRTRSQCERIARSEIIRASAEAQESVLAQNNIENYVWISAVDGRTCEVCRELHKTVHSVGQGPRPVRDTHPNCRCAIVADR